MAFPTASARTPTLIGDIEISMTSPDPTGTAQPSASFVVWVRYSDGSIKQVAGDLVPHLTQAHITAILNFLNDMRAKAIAEILP